MNFYKHHIGDYDQATRHLSFVEDAAYSRLIRKYYAEEKPLPADIKQVQRLVGAREKAEKEAVATVLDEFFVLQDDGWHNKRCDEEVAQANKQAEANRLIALEREAKKRARKEQEETTNRVGKQHESWSGSEHESWSSREPSQTPDTRHQTPDLKPLGESIASGTPATVRPTIPNPPTCEAHWASHFRHSHGVEINPSSVHDRKKAWPIFAGWVRARLSLERVDAAVAQAQAQATESIAYLPGYVDRVIASQAAPKQATSAVRDQERADVIATLTGRKPTHERTPDTLDVAARRVD